MGLPLFALSTISLFGQKMGIIKYLHYFRLDNKHILLKRKFYCSGVGERYLRVALQTHVLKIFACFDEGISQTWKKWWNRGTQFPARNQGCSHFQGKFTYKENKYAVTFVCRQSILSVCRHLGLYVCGISVYWSADIEFKFLYPSVDI